MSEILRAVLDASCTFSAPAFYNVPITSPLNGGVVPIAMQGRLQLKADRWFLQTGLMFANVVGAPRYQASDFDRIVSLQNLKNAKTYFSAPLQMQAIACGENATSQLTFPHYILWEPASLVGVTTTNLPTDATNIAYCVMAGIEYAR